MDEVFGRERAERSGRAEYRLPGLFVSGPDGRAEGNGTLGKQVSPDPGEGAHLGVRDRRGRRAGTAGGRLHIRGRNSCPVDGIESRSDPLPGACGQRAAAISAA